MNLLYWVIPLAIFGASLLALLFLIIAKLPALSRLPDLPVRPEVEQKKKDQLMALRFRRIWKERFKKISRIWDPVVLKIKQSFFILYRRIQEIERRYQKQGAISREEEKDRIQKLIWTAGELANQGQFEEAEKKYIDVITWDHRNLAAYKGLADLYWKKKDYQQAKDTLEHTLKIAPTDAELYWELASVYQEQGQMDRAFDNFERAQELAPNNPKYLDSLLEICLSLNKKDLAWKLVSKLKEVNPENQKLKDFEERIRKL